MKTEAMKEFKTYLEGELLSATHELERIETEESRKHLQKLVYANLVDRFDSMIDLAILENFSNEILINEVLKGMDKSFTEAEFVKTILLGSGLKEMAEEKVKEALRTSILRQRHSKKFSKLCEVFLKNENAWNLPRVNISTGSILSEIKIQDKATPYSICGYADWLYSRRNAIVHRGGNSKYLDNDRKQIETMFKVKLKKTFRILLSSIKTASKFYLSVIELFEKNLSNKKG